MSEVELCPSPIEARAIRYLPRGHGAREFLKRSLPLTCPEQYAVPD